MSRAGGIPGLQAGEDVKSKRRRTKAAIRAARPFTRKGTESEGNLNEKTGPREVALIKRSKDGSLRARGAYERFDLPLSGEGKPGDLITVRRSKRRAELCERIGRPSSVKTAVEALAIAAGELPHGAALEGEARAAARRGMGGGRRDLRKLPTFTIDGEATRDFDDAISARREGRRIRVWVHVADVSAYVRPGSPLDRDARRRATSVYLPTLTVPMLPRALSEGACSLVPGAERAAVSCELLLEGRRLRERRIYRSVIRSDARLTYDHVDQVFLGRAEPGPTYAAALAAARQAALDRTRAGDGGEERSEPIFELSGDGREVIGISERRETESHRLIERLMVLANEQVASFLEERGVPTLYRTHSAANPERLERMLRRLRSLGLEPTEPTFQAALEAARKTGNEVLISLVLASRAPACYERELGAHEGLGLASYCHFTSPIRRYADLVVHRALLAELGLEPLATAPRYSELPEAAEALNERTRTARKLARRAEAICRVSLLRRRLRRKEIGRELEGRITGVGKAGVFVEIDCCEGLIGARRLGGGANPEETVWRTAQERELRPGESVRVRIAEIDPVRGRLELDLSD